MFGQHKYCTSKICTEEQILSRLKIIHAFACVGLNFALCPGVEDGS